MHDVQQALIAFFEWLIGLLEHVFGPHFEPASERP